MEQWMLIIKLKEWRDDPSQFFIDITGLTPAEFQDKFLLDMADIKTKINCIISAGRGTGKTLTLALLTLWYTFVLPKFLRRPVKVVVLGGSFEQSKILYNYVKLWCYQHDFIKEELAKEPTMYETLFSDGSSVKALTASEKSVRGPRSDLLIIDEAVEAGEELIDAAMQINITSDIARTIISSTPHEYNSLFVDIISKPEEYGFTQPYYWSGEKAFWISQKTLAMKRKMMSDGRYSIEIEGRPYAFQGKVFPLASLKKCIVKKTKKMEDLETLMGIDWGHYPAPTVGIIIQRVSDKIQVLFTESYLKEKFEEVLDSLETIARTYKVQAIYVDSIPPGEGARLANRGLPVYPIKFKGEKPMMISNLQALIENERIEIPEDFFGLISQLRTYRFDTKKEDDFVDALMLACRPLSPSSIDGDDLKKYIFIRRRRTDALRNVVPGTFSESESGKIPEGMCQKCGKNPVYKTFQMEVENHIEEVGLCMDCTELYLDRVRTKFK